MYTPTTAPMLPSGGLGKNRCFLWPLHLVSTRWLIDRGNKLQNFILTHQRHECVDSGLYSQQGREQRSLSHCGGMNSVLSNGMPRSGLYLVTTHIPPTLSIPLNPCWKASSETHKKHNGNTTLLSPWCFRLPDEADKHRRPAGVKQNPTTDQTKVRYFPSKLMRKYCNVYFALRTAYWDITDTLTT